jgi:hypothetical protein
MVFEGLRKLVGHLQSSKKQKKMDLYSPQLAEHSQPSKNNKRSTCTHSHSQNQKKKKEFILTPQPSKREKKNYTTPKPLSPFPQNKNKK